MIQSEHIKSSNYAQICEPNTYNRKRHDLGGHHSVVGRNRELVEEVIHAPLLSLELPNLSAGITYETGENALEPCNEKGCRDGKLRVRHKDLKVLESHRKNSTLEDDATGHGDKPQTLCDYGQLH